MGTLTLYDSMLCLLESYSLSRNSVVGVLGIFVSEVEKLYRRGKWIQQCDKSEQRKNPFSASVALEQTGSALNPKLWVHLLYFLGLKAHRMKPNVDSSRNKCVRWRVFENDQARKIGTRSMRNPQTEFGINVASGLTEGYTRIDRLSWENFNESALLQDSVERYKAQYGIYPEAVLVGYASVGRGWDGRGKRPKKRNGGRGWMRGEGIR